MLSLIVLITAGIVTSSTAIACARSSRNAMTEPATIQRGKSKTSHMTQICVGTAALGAVILAVHVQLGGSF